MGQFVRTIHQVIDKDTGRIIYEEIEDSRRRIKHEMTDSIICAMAELDIGIKDWLKVIEVTSAKIEQYATTEDTCECPAARFQHGKPCKHQIARRLGIVSM